jgi:hypothetical protein
MEEKRMRIRGGAHTMGRACAAVSTIIALASASDIAGDETSRILGFVVVVAGSVGTAGSVLTSFANFTGASTAAVPPFHDVPVGPSRRCR